MELNEIKFEPTWNKHYTPKVELNEIKSDVIEDTWNERLHLKTEFNEITYEGAEDTLNKAKYDVNSEKKNIEELFPKLCTDEIHIKDEFQESHVETNNENSKFTATAETTNNGLQENYDSEEATSHSLESLNTSCIYNYKEQHLYSNIRDERNQDKTKTIMAFKLDQHTLTRPLKITTHNQACEPKSVTKSSLIKNVPIRTDETFYECHRCDYRSSQKSHLVVHSRTHTKEMPYECLVCQRKFTTTSSLKRHMRVHTGEKPYECSICKQEFGYATMLADHARIHTGEKPYECNMCEFKCAQKSNLYVHMKAKHTDPNGKPHACNLCEVKFWTKYQLVEHIRTHTGEKPYRCRLCHYRCAKNSGLHAHMRTHTGEKPYACPTCGRKYSQKRSLVQHKCKHTNVGHQLQEINSKASEDTWIEAKDDDNLAIAEATNKGLQENCDSEEATSNSLKCVNASQIHRDEEQYLYSNIQVGTDTHERSQDNANTVMAFKLEEHTLTRPLKIATHIQPCESKSVSKSSLVKHVPIHTDETFYKCHRCGYRCSYKSHLITHIRTHSGERPYECHVCQRKFNLKGNIKRHMRVHTFEKPYECSICKKAFRHSTSLVGHLRIHTGEKPYECHICEYKSSIKRNLRRHIKAHSHPNTKLHGYDKHKSHEINSKTSEDTWNETKYDDNLEKRRIEELFPKLCTDELNIKDEFEESRVETNDKDSETEATNKSLQENYESEEATSNSLKILNASQILRDEEQYLYSNIEDDTDTHERNQDNTNSIMAFKLDEHTLTRPLEIATHIQPCESKSVSKSSFVKNVPIRTDETFYECHTCGYRSSHKSHLVIHIGTHTKGMPYECLVCQRKFTTTTLLKRHMRVHTGAKPYECNICEFKCAQKSNLYGHIKAKHADPNRKPYACNLCEVKFWTKHQLVEHIRTHTGVKPYRCGLCQYECSRNSGFYAHMRTHTGEKPYACPTCDRKYSQKRSLVQHKCKHPYNKHECHEIKSEDTWNEANYDDNLGKKKIEELFPKLCTDELNIKDEYEESHVETNNEDSEFTEAINMGLPENFAFEEATSNSLECVNATDIYSDKEQYLYSNIHDQKL